MKELSLNEVLTILCAPDPVDIPQESDFLSRSAEDEAADELFVKRWIARERR